MSLVLLLEHGPRRQAREEARLERGQLVIGRSPSADWQIDDPDMFVSRAHCTVSGTAEEGYTVTDTSSSGLFVDDDPDPLGAGNSVRLRSGMRLRLGEFVIGIALEQPRAERAAPERTFASERPAPPSPAAAAGLGADDFFSARAAEAQPAPRPASLPDPFEKTGPSSAFERPAAPASLAFDDPFSLDPVSTPDLPPPEASDDPWSGSAWSEDWKPEPAAPPPQPPSPSHDDDPFSMSQSGSGWSGKPMERPQPVAAPQPPAPAHLAPAPPPEMPAPFQAYAPPPAQPPAYAQPRSASQQAVGNDALREAFFRGMELDATEFPCRDPQAEMERFGREYRMMMEGLMQLLRKRAEEKGSVRVAQTVVGASEVNPLKFLPSVEDVVGTWLSERSPGFLRGEAAIADGVRDLVQHHVRAWRGVQGALRRMVDRFDPAALEEELKGGSAMETILAGGKSAKLWDLYKKRHKEIALNAEQRFLGDLGVDFRDAYEGD